MLDGSIVEISLPAIFHGIGVNPLARGETDYLLWTLMGYLVVTATLLVTFGRISDMWGRVRMYNLGFAIFAVGSILLYLVHGTGNLPDQPCDLPGGRVDGVGQRRGERQVQVHLAEGAVNARPLQSLAVDLGAPGTFAHRAAGCDHSCVGQRQVYGLAATYGDRFEPPASLVEKAERGETYADEQTLVAS